MKKLHLDQPRTLSKSPRNLERHSTPHTTKASASTTINIPSQLLGFKSHKSTQKLSKLQGPIVNEFPTKNNMNSLHKRTGSRGKSFDLKLGTIQIPSEGNTLSLNHPRDRDSKSQQHRERYSETYGQVNYLPEMKPKQNNHLQEMFHKRKASLSQISNTLHAKQLVDHLENINPNKGRPKPTLITHVNLTNNKPLKEVEIEESKESSLNGSLLAGSSLIEYRQNSPKNKTSRTLQEINYHSHHSHNSHHSNSVGYPVELKATKRSSQTESLTEQLKMQEKKMNVPSLGNLSHGGSFQLGTSHGSLDNHSIKNKERNSFKASVNSHQTSCKNHNNKKAKYIQVGVENSLEQKISHYYCSECAVEAALKDGYVQKLETSTSRLHTEESKGSKEGHEGQGEVMKASKSSRKVEGKSENQYNKDRSATREVEVRGFIQKIQENLKKVPVLESKFLKEKNQLQTNLKTINEKIQEFTAKVVKVLQEQTEEMLTNLNVEFGREMIRLSSFSEKLKNTNKGLQEISTDIESNYKRILHNIDEKPYRMIMDKYMERLPSFEKFFYNAKNFHMDYTKFLPTEKIAHFKRILKTFMNEAFAGYTTDIEACNSRLSHNSRLNKEALSSPPMHEFKTGEFEVFLRSEESEDVRGTKPNNPNNTNNTINTTNTINTNTINTFSTNHMLVSFENKDIFQNALQNSIEPITTTNFTRDSQSNTITSNVFVSDPEEFGNPLFLEALKTPKLNFEIEAALNEEVSSFTEDDFSSYREKDSSISSQTMSGSSSLNKYMSLLEKVNQKQDTRSQYLKSGRVYENGKKPSQVYDHVNLMNYIENKLKDENMREPCQKSLFQSPAFKEMDEDDGMLSY